MVRELVEVQLVKRPIWRDVQLWPPAGRPHNS